MSKLPAIIGEAIAGVASELSGHAVPGSTLVSQAIDSLLEPRRRRAADDLTEALRRGGLTLEEAIRKSPQMTVPMLLRYFRAADEGAARRNLRLLAQVFAGMVQRRPIYANEFLQVADILASLRREEIVLIGTLHRHLVPARAEGARDGAEASRADQAARKELVPNIFSTKEMYEAVAGACMRTGLVVAVSGFGGLVYGTSPLMDQLAGIVSFDDATAEGPEDDEDRPD